tara:strand:- start:133 stop:297 length:165 start_codon:yes stop_codon:yes gene_type:complete
MKPDREKLKLIVRNLKLLIDSLESEVLSDVDAYSYKPAYYEHHQEFDDDDGYTD